VPAAHPAHLQAEAVRAEVNGGELHAARASQVSW
jgi:hypothetical protein